MKLVGVDKRKGEFQDKISGKVINYDNYMLHLEAPFPADEETKRGTETTVIKIKRDEFEKICEVSDPNKLIGAELDFQYSLYAGKPYLSSIRAI